MKVTKINAVMLLISVLLMTTNAAAVNEIIIYPVPPSQYISPDGTFQLPVGADAYESIGLAVEFKNFSNGRQYEINITRDSDGATMYFNRSGLQDGNLTVPVGWLVPNDLTQNYTLNATGLRGQGKKLRTTKTAAINPVPELNTLILTSAGVFGIMLVSWRFRRNYH